MIAALSFHCEERIDWEPEVCPSFTPDLSSFLNNEVYTIRPLTTKFIERQNAELRRQQQQQAGILFNGCFSTPECSFGKPSQK